jgi:hypothetical protein
MSAARPVCLYCHRRFPGNQVVEMFPHGRRIGIDAGRNRYWLICARCGQWNMAPLSYSDRAIMIDWFERWWSGSATRYTREGIGIGRYENHLDVVRIGEAGWAEFASWRYGQALMRRRLWRVGVDAAMLVGAVSLWSAGVIGAANAAGVIGAHVASTLLYRKPHLRARRAVCRVSGAMGSRPVLRVRHLEHLEIASQHGELTVLTLYDGGASRLEGLEALTVLGLALPRINYYGGQLRPVREAIRLIREAGDADAFIASAASRRWHKGNAPLPLVDHPAELRMALEMALHDRDERHRAAEELEALRRSWREAEELAPDWMQWT